MKEEKDTLEGMWKNVKKERKKERKNERKKERKKERKVEEMMGSPECLRMVLDDE